MHVQHPVFDLANVNGGNFGHSIGNDVQYDVATVSFKQVSKVNTHVSGVTPIYLIYHVICSIVCKFIRGFIQKC